MRFSRTDKLVFAVGGIVILFFIFLAAQQVVVARIEAGIEQPARSSTFLRAAPRILPARAVKPATYVPSPPVSQPAFVEEAPLNGDEAPQVETLPERHAPDMDEPLLMT